MPATRGGPGRTRPSGRRDKHVSVRADERTKAALERAAAKHNQTVSSEAAERLARTFREDAGLAETFDQRTRGLLALVGQLERGVKLMTGRSWRDDPYTYRELAAGVDTLLGGLPALLSGRTYAVEPEVPERVKQLYPDAASKDGGLAPGELGRRVARGLLDTLPLMGGPPPATDYVSVEMFSLSAVYHDLGLGRRNR
jgi:hypothetical protein